MMSDPTAPISPFAPLRFSAFRALWLMWLLTNVCIWMWSVAAAWMMVEMHVSPVWVAMVQGATFAPLLVFGLPCGALADMVDRRALLLATQLLMAALGLLQGALALLGTPSPLVLLLTTFAFGCGMALRNPAYHAVVPGQLPRPVLANALALNAVAMNASRVIGPLLTGVLIVAVGPPSVFLIIATICGLAFLLVNAWKPETRQINETRPASFTAVMREGMVFMLQSKPLRSNLVRVAAFCGSVTALPALLPLVARDIEGGNASTYSLLFAAMGIGAVMSMAFLHRLRARHARERLELASAVAHGVAVIAMVVSHSLTVAVVAMLVTGVAWISGANSMTVAAQLLLPDNMRARGMAIHHMALMGSIAFGSYLWGQVATLSSINVALAASALCVPLGVGAAIRFLPQPPMRF